MLPLVQARPPGLPKQGSAGPAHSPKDAHWVPVLLPASGVNLPRCLQSCFDLSPSGGPILINTEYLCFSDGHRWWPKMQW